MRITFLCPSRPEPVGGVIALYEFANGLARRGHHVHLVHLPMWDHQVTSLAELDRHRFEPGIVHHLPGDGPTNFTGSDIVFGTGPLPDSFGLPVLLLQGFDMLHPHLERDALRTPCLKVCVASWLVDVGVRYGVSPDDMHVVAMGIDHDRFCISTPVEHRPLRVAMLHSTHEAKGWDVGLQALHQIRREVPGVRATVFGTTRPSEELPDWIDLHLDPPPDVLAREIYNQARVFIQPSHHEGFGFTAVEAMACGCALVTTDNGGSDDYAIDGVTARVVAPGDARGLVDRTVELLGDDTERIRLARSGQHHVQRFDWDEGAAALEDLLERYVDDPVPFQQPPGPEPPPDGPEARHPIAARHLRQTGRPLGQNG